jgi:hypothetical protein
MTADLVERRAPTEHIIEAVYESAYWGGTYKVVGTHGENGVEVECVTPGQGAHQIIGKRSVHFTTLDKRDKRIG